MSNTTEKKFSQDIEIELKDFNNNSPSEIGFSQVENNEIFGILDNREKKQRIDQQDYLFNWIISICNKFLIGVSLVFCMFMFEIKKNFSDLNFIDNYLYSYQKFITLLDVTLSWISPKNFRFIFLIGTTHLFQVIFSNLTVFNLLDLDFKNEILFDFFTYKKKSPKNMKLYIKSERYRFWKNIKKMHRT